MSVILALMVATFVTRRSVTCGENGEPSGWVRSEVIATVLGYGTPT